MSRIIEHAPILKEITRSSQWKAMAWYSIKEGPSVFFKNAVSTDDVLILENNRELLAKEQNWYLYRE